MAGTLRTKFGDEEMKIELLKPYGVSAVGDILNPGQAIADMLIERKIAKLVVTKKKRAKKCSNTK
jgi:hypothetical protein